MEEIKQWPSFIIISFDADYSDDVNDDNYTAINEDVNDALTMGVATQLQR